MADATVLRTARQLRKEGKPAEALALLREALRRGQLAPEETERVGSLIARMLPEAGQEQLRVLLLGQFTTTWLATALAAVAWGHGAALDVAEGGYDSILQYLSAAAPEARPSVLVLLPWNQRLLGGAGRPTEERIADELTLWRQAWALAGERLGARIVQVGYDWVEPGPLGHHLGGGAGGDVALVRQANAALRAALPPGAFFVDLEQVSGAMGRERFYAMRRYFWTKQPFSEAGACRLAEHLWAAIRALLTGPKKVLVLDLDDTLWGGIVGEAGPLGIALGEGPDGEAFRAFQRHLKGLAQRGVLLAVCSKNNPDDAREPFEKNPNMVLGLDDFAAFEASWEPKAAAIRRIAEGLGLGLDSFVYFDDSPTERESVRQALPEVEVVEVPPDPAEYVQTLQAGLWFEALALTPEDRERAALYRQEHQRRSTQQAFASLDDYLASLGLCGEVRNIGEGDLPRCAQLVARTNQFNLTARRHSLDDLRSMIALPGTIALSLRLRDKFGDYGLVSVILAVPHGPHNPPPSQREGVGGGCDLSAEAAPVALRVDTWVMSCRIIGRTAEEFLFNALLARARVQGCRQLIGEYVPTKKNAVVRELYARLGFAPLGEAPDGSARYALDLAAASPARTFVSEPTTPPDSGGVM